MTGNAEGAIAQFLDDQKDAQTEFLAALVRQPSDNPPGDCRAHGDRAAALFEELGFAVERHPVPDATVRAHGMVSVTNLVVRRRFGDGPVIALNAHGDVVPPGDGWTVDPYGAEIAAVGSQGVFPQAFLHPQRVEVTLDQRVRQLCGLRHGRRAYQRDPLREKAPRCSVRPGSAQETPAIEKEKAARKPLSPFPMPQPVTAAFTPDRVLS